MENNKIIFRDSDHSYWNGDQRYIGVNTFLSKFGFKFDSDFWLVWKGLQSVIPKFANLYFKSGFDFDLRQPDIETLCKKFQKDLDKLNLTVEEIVVPIQESWDESARLGTEFHNERENEAYELGYIINPYNKKKYKTQPRREAPTGYDNQSTTDFLKNLEDGAYAELLLFLPEYLLAGLGDDVFVETVGKTRYIDIGDHKTNSKVPINTKNKNDKLLYPINKFYNNTFTKYWFQTSMYGKMLSKYGYEVRNIGFYHYKNYSVKTRKVYNLDYLDKECEKLLEMRLEYLNDW